MKNEDWVTVAHAAEITHYSRRTIQHLLKKKAIHGRKVERDWLVDLASLKEYQRFSRRGRPRSATRAEGRI